MRHLYIVGKLGTHPSAIYFVRAEDGGVIDEPPSTGDEVQIRSDQDSRVNNWQKILVDRVCFGNFYFMSFL